MKNRTNSLSLGLFSLVLAIVLALMGCGGGSAGTGTGSIVVVEGAVFDDSGRPLQDVSVRVVESGGEATTSQSGEFQVLAPPETETITLEVTSESGPVFTTVTIPKEGGTVSVRLTVNPKVSEISADSLEVGAAIVGACDRYFENNLIIRQSNKVPSKLSCVAKVTISTDGKGVARIPFAVQYRDCDQLLPWTTVAVGSTMGTPNLGVGQVRFPFKDDETHCVYRIVAPFGVPNLPELERLVRTSTYQRRK